MKPVTIFLKSFVHLARNLPTHMRSTYRVHNVNDLLVLYNRPFYSKVGVLIREEDKIEKVLMTQKRLF